MVHAPSQNQWVWHIQWRSGPRHRSRWCPLPAGSSGTRRRPGRRAHRRRRRASRTGKSALLRAIELTYERAGSRPVGVHRGTDLAGVAETVPLLVDDADRLDSATLAVLRTRAGNPGPRTVVTYRLWPRHGGLSALGRGSPGTTRRRAWVPRQGGGGSGRRAAWQMPAFCHPGCPRVRASPAACRCSSVLSLRHYSTPAASTPNTPSGSGAQPDFGLAGSRRAASLSS